MLVLHRLAVRLGHVHHERRFFAWLADGMTARPIGAYPPVRWVLAAPVCCAFVSFSGIGPLPAQRFLTVPCAAVRFQRTRASAGHEPVRFDAWALRSPAATTWRALAPASGGALPDAV